MFSFFGKKKSSPVTLPEEAIDPIPSYNSNIPSADDNFVFIERKMDPPPTHGQGGMYPPMPPGIPYPAAQINNNPSSSMDKSNSLPSNYLQGVPFKLSPELCQGNSLDRIQFEMDEILALLTRRLDIDMDYNFDLEKEIVTQ